MTISPVRPCVLLFPWSWSAEGAAVSGGFNNTASNSDATVSGGANNVASGYLSVVSGGNTIAASTINGWGHP
jgi:hypothetical protein